MRLSKIAFALPAAALLFAIPAGAQAAQANGVRTKSSHMQTVAQKKMKPTKTTSAKSKTKPKGGSY